MVKRDITVLKCDLCGYEKQFNIQESINIKREFLELDPKASTDINTYKHVCKSCADKIQGWLLNINKPKTSA